MENLDKAQPVNLKATRKLETVEDFQRGMQFLALSMQRSDLIRELDRVARELKPLAVALGIPADQPIAFDGKAAFVWQVNGKVDATKESDK